MRKIIEIEAGDPIPEKAKYLYSKEVPDKSRARREWRPTPGFWGSMPIFGSETLYEITPHKTIHFYEVES